MDDFIYGEPQAIPEPVSLSILSLGAFAMNMRRHRH
jgi:hypothetical protein